MNKIVCPHCRQEFELDAAGYAEIVKQVRNHEFSEELQERLAQVQREHEGEMKLARAADAQEAQQALAAKDSEILGLKSKLEAGDAQKKMAVTEALSPVEKQRDALVNQVAQLKRDQQMAAELAETKRASDVQNAVSAVEKERDQLKNELEQAALKKRLGEQAIADKYETALRTKDEQIKDREDTIERLKDLKSRLSTKMIGETLEQHCENSFNQIRAVAFPLAQFDKDNDPKSGTKGDYIFRDVDAAGIEIVSIMFEMKNESDTTATKTKNEDFLDKLHKDRTEKGCEYAILVSLLEPDSELYNTGIVDKSHRHPKMFVIRPQFFLQIIALLRNAAMKALQYKSELALVKSQNIDISDFEARLEEFKGGFGRNYDLASRQFQDAIDEIDEVVKRMGKTKEYLQKSANNLRLANEKIQDVTIKRLTKGNETMATKFKELKTGGDTDAD